MMTTTKKLQIGLLCVGAALLFAGGRELLLCAKASPTPQTISYRQLATQGYGKNAHITLTNALPVTMWMVYYGKGDDGPWTRVYFPAIADDNPWIEAVMANSAANRPTGQKIGMGMPKDIHVLVKFTGIKNAKDLTAKLTAHFQADNTIRGTIINEIDSLGSKEKALLQQGYPSLDVNRVLILEVDRMPSTTKGLALIGGGMVGALLGSLWLLTSFRRSRQAARFASAPPPLAAQSHDNQSQRERDEAQLAQFDRDEEQRKR